MKNNLTLGSLFDGSGGFPLGGLISGIIPLWASEVEPFPIRVTTKRLPQVKHLGDVSKINGGEIPPVDIITFGSPCQDMSIAGKREGLAGGRSSLFYEAVRIIKEMRCKTNGEYPRFVVWENVPGAFSSNKGEDFREVLKSLCEVKSADVTVPEPPKGKWKNAGNIVADDFSIAWRVLDAQYWGVPQRRKRIYLVADFAGRCAGKILFESEGLSGDFKKGIFSWKGTAECIERGTDETGSKLVFENHSQDTRYTGPLETAPTVSSTYGTGGNNQPFVVEGAKCFDVRFTSEGTRNARHNCYETDTSRTIDTGGNAPDSNQGGVAVVYGICAKDSNAMKSSNPHSGFYEADTARCLDGNGGNPTCNQGGMAVVSLQGSMIGRKEENGPRGDGINEDVSFTLNATDKHAVVYAIDREAFNCGQKFARTPGINDKGVNSTLNTQGPSAVAIPVFSSSKASFFTEANEELANTLVATDYKDPPIVNDNAPSYIVRRLTPTECARLQGFPDWWCSHLETEEPTENDIKFWSEVFETHREVIGKSTKPKSEKQIIKWLKAPHSDSAEYKLWGNGVALPNVVFVLSGIVYYAQNSNKE
ncbi:DNA cytosine methyltransferase [Clostridium paraputrificum]|uniref:DNA cytosine methyltransferase n=1 Tax=Clostridium paraputrificum TaxID=29363 RepID=UPI003567FA22